MKWHVCLSSGEMVEVDAMLPRVDESGALWFYALTPADRADLVVACFAHRVWLRFSPEGANLDKAEPPSKSPSSEALARQIGAKKECLMHGNYSVLEASCPRCPGSETARSKEDET